MDKELKIKISVDKKTGAIKVVDGEFRELSNSANKAERNVDSFSKSLGNSGKKADSFSQSLRNIDNNIKNVLQIAGSFYIVSQAIDAATSTAQSFFQQSDDMTNVNSKLKLVTSSSQELATVQKELFDISQDTRTSLLGNVDLYQRMDMSTKELNVSQKEMLSMNESINQAMKISGTTAAGADTLVTQLGQAFSSNFQAVAQELGTIRDQAPRLYQALLTGAGMTSAAFKKAAEDGELSSEIIINALQKQASAIDEDFQKMAITIDGATQKIANSSLQIVEKIDKITGASKSVSSSIDGISKSLDALSEDDIQNYADLAGNIGLVTSSLIGAKVGLAAYNKISKSVLLSNSLLSVSYTALSTSLGRAIVVTKALSLAQKAMPFVAVVAGIYLIVDAWMDANDAARKYQDTVDKNSKGYSGKGVMADYKYETSVKNLVEAFDKMENLEEIYLDTRNHQYAKHFEEQYLSAKSNYLKIEKEAIEISDRTFQTISKNIKSSSSSNKSTTLTKAQKEQLSLTKQLQSAISKSNPYDDLVYKFDEYLGKAKGNKENLLLIDKWYSINLDKLNKNELEIYSKTLLKKEKEVADVATTSLGSWKEYYEGINDYETSWLIQESQLKTKFIDLTDEQFTQAATLAKTKYFDTLANEEIKLNTQAIDDVMNPMESILDMQIQLAESGMDWTNSLSGQAGAMADIGSSFKKLHVDKLKLEKEDLKLQETYAKKFLEANGDVAKEKQALAQFDSEQSAMREQEIGNYIGAFGSLAGAVSQYAEEGSKAAQAAEVAQKSLAVVSAVQAVIRAWGDPYPLNLITVPATILATGALLSSIGVSSGGGGSSSAVSAQQTADSKWSAELTELSMQPMIDRLDRQIELLEIIGLEGTAGRFGIQAASTQYEMDVKLLAEDIIQGTQTVTVMAGSGGATQNDVTQTWDYAFSKINDSIADTLFDLSDGMDSVSFDAQVFRDNTLKSLSELYNYDLLNVLANWEEAAEAGARTWEQFAAFAESTGVSQINELQAVTQDYILSLADVVDGMTDAKDSMKNLYDEVTSTSFYSDKDLSQAQDDVDRILSASNLSFEEYLQKQIASIEEVEKAFTTDITELFLSANPADLEEQAKALEMLAELMDTEYAGGVEEALNYMDSIELVGEAMVEAKEFAKELTLSVKDLISSYTGIDSIDTSSMKDWTESLPMISEEMKKGYGTGEAYYNMLSAVNRGLIDLTEEQLEMAESMGDILNQQQDVAQDRIQSIVDEINAYQTLIDAGDSAIDGILNITKTLEELSNIEITKDNANEVINDIVKAYGVESSAIETAISGIDSELDTFESAIETLSGSISDFSKEIREYITPNDTTGLIKSYQEALAYARNDLTSDSFSALQTSATSYIGAEQNLAVNREDFNFFASVMANEIDSLGVDSTSDNEKIINELTASRESLELELLGVKDNALSILDTTIATLDAYQATHEAEFLTEVKLQDQYFGENSSIVTWLKTIAEELGFEEQVAAIIAQPTVSDSEVVDRSLYPQFEDWQFEANDTLGKLGEMFSVGEISTADYQRATLTAQTARAAGLSNEDQMTLALEGASEGRAYLDATRLLDGIGSEMLVDQSQQDWYRNIAEQSADNNLSNPTYTFEGNLSNTGVSNSIDAIRQIALAEGKIVPFANGGIITSPTYSLMGEAGPEGVFPLDNKNQIPMAEVVAELRAVRKELNEIKQLSKKTTTNTSTLAKQSLKIDDDDAIKVRITA